MRINTNIVIDMATYEVLDRESFEYDGPIALCCGGGGGGESAASAAGVGLGGVPGAEAGYGGSAGISGMGTSGIGAAGVGAPGGPGVVGPGPGGAQVGFSNRGAQIGSMIGSIFGAPGTALGALVGGVIGSAAQGSGVQGGADMSGDHTGGNAIAGPDSSQTKRAAITAEGTGKAGKKAESGLSLKDVTKDAEDEELKKARKRPKTILTSPLGLRSRPSIRRATLLGG